MAIIGSVSIRVLPDTKAFVPSLEKFLTRTEARHRLNIGLDLDTSGVNAQMREVQARLSGRTIDLDATANTAAATTSVNALIARLSGRNIALGVDIDRSKVDLAARAVTSLVGTLGKLGASTLGVGAVGASLGGLAQGALAAGAAVVELSGSLALLPALGASAAAAIGTLVVGMQGFGDALKNLDDPAKFGEAIAKLAPSARATAIAVRDLAPAFSALRLDVQQALFRGLGTTITQIGTQYLPVLRTGMTAVATSFNTVAQNVAGFVSNAQTVRDTGALFTQTSASVTILGGAIRDVLFGLRDVGAVGATFLPGLAQGAANAAARFREFMASARESGRIREWIETGLNAIRQLGAIVGNVGTILGQMFRAAQGSGAGFLATVERVTESLATFFSSVQGAFALQQVFSGISAALSGLTVLLEPLQQTFLALAPVVQQVGTLLGQAFAALAPAIPPITQALAAVAPVLGQLATQLATLLVPAVQIVAPLFAQLAPIVAQIATALVPMVQQVLGLARAFMPIVPLIGQLVSTLLPPLSALFSSLMRALMPLAQALMRAAQQILPPLAQAFGQLISAITPLLPPIGRLIASLLPPLVQIIKAIIPIIGPLANLFNLLVSAILPLLKPILTLISTLLPPLVRLLISIVTPVINMASAFLQKAIPAINAVIGVVVKVIGWLGRMLGKVAEAVGGVIRFFGNLGAKIIGAVAGAGSWLVQTGVNLITGLLRGIGNAAAKVGEFLLNLIKDAVGGVLDFLGIGSPSRYMAKVGRWTAEGLAGGIDDATPAAIRAADRLARGVAISPEMDASIRTAGSRSSFVDELREAMSGLGIEVNAGQLTRWIDQQQRLNMAR